MLRGGKKNSIYGVFCSESFKKKRENIDLFDDFQPLRGWEQSCTGSNNNNKPQPQQQQEQEQQEQQEQQQQRRKQRKQRNL